MRGQDDVADVADGHVAVDAVRRLLGRHDTARGIVYQDVDAVRGVGDLLGDGGERLPIGEVGLQKLDFGDGRFAERLFDVG